MELYFHFALYLRLWEATSNGYFSKMENSSELFVKIYVVSGFEYTIFLNKFRQIIFIKNTVNW